MNAPGSVIDDLMNASSGSPAFWASPPDLSRAGPIVPEVPATASAWQLPQAVAREDRLAVGGVAGRAARAPVEPPPLSGGGVDVGVEEARVESDAVDSGGVQSDARCTAVVAPATTITTIITTIPATVPMRPAIKTFSMARGLYRVSRRIYRKQGMATPASNAEVE